MPEPSYGPDLERDATDAERDALSSGPRCLGPLERDAMDTVGGAILDG